MLKTELTVVTLGEPNVNALTESERRTFFETLLNRITVLKQSKETNKE